MALHLECAESGEWTPSRPYVSLILHVLGCSDRRATFVDFICYIVLLRKKEDTTTAAIVLMTIDSWTEEQASSLQSSVMYADCRDAYLGCL